jgi:hypothetical protein
MYLKYFLLLLLTKPVVSLQFEKQIRDEIFTDYNPNIRPVRNYNNDVNLSISIKIKNIESFNQITETLFLNLWIIYEWDDKFLRWNSTQYPIKKISVNKHQVWTPDLVLYNAAQKPNQYNLGEYMRLESNGRIKMIKPLTFGFTCSLNLQNFPFDQQICYMEFGSWTFHNKYLYIHSYPENNTIDFSNTQGEWEILEFTTTNQQLEYLCCPDEYWSVIKYEITLDRYSKSYSIFIVMTALLTITANVINIFNYKIYTRTYILIFIPLTIIWLVQSVSNKIPVIGYFSKMDTILLVSFIICELCTLQSGVLFNLSKNKNYFLKVDQNQNYKYKSTNLLKKNVPTRSYDFVKYDEQILESVIYFIDNILKYMILLTYIIFLFVILYS